MLETLSTVAKKITSFAASFSGYDAVKEKNKRAAPGTILRSQDAELVSLDRKKMVVAARDIERNFSLAAWMIRRHLDYVSTFNFQAKTGNPDTDDALEQLVKSWNSPNACDVTGRFTLSKMIRLLEMRRVIDGDIFILKLADGRLQIIEGDRVRSPEVDRTKKVQISDSLLHGVKLAADGKPESYCVCTRPPVFDTGQTNAWQFVFERMIEAKNLYHFAYIDRFDQVRGVTPLASSLNTLRDVYEGFDYALAKLKVSQLFGLVFYRDKDDSLGVESSSTDGSGYTVDFGKGPAVLDLDAGDKAEFLESKSPGSEFESFTQTMIGVALKSLDIPYSFYAENFTNYSGARQALLQYQLAAKIRRQDILAMLDHLTAWRIGLWIQDGLLPVDMVMRWDWVPQGVSWIDPMKEVNANIAAIGARLTTRTRVMREQGNDFYEMADELKAEEDYMESIGLPMSVGLQPSISEVVQPEQTGKQDA